MSASSNTVDPFRVYSQAEAFYHAAAALDRSSSPYYIQWRIPPVMCSAFALELYLKCLILLETGKWIRTHDLKKLFMKLTTDSQIFLRDQTTKKLDEINTRFTELEKSGEPRPVHHLTFDYALDKSKDAFTIYRYLFEQSAAPFGYWLLGPMLGAAKHRILALEPDFARYVYELIPLKPLP
jgi:HEPN domain-containing protein